MFDNWQHWPIVRPVLAFFSSRKFIALLLAVLITDFGLDLSDNAQAMIYFLAAGVYGLTTSIEDAAAKRGAS